MPLRTLVLAVLLASLLPACQGSVTDAAPAGSTGASRGAGGGVTSTSSSGTGGAAPSTCTFTVSGAIDATVVSAPSSPSGYPEVFAYPEGLTCANIAGGFGDFVTVGFGSLHGPGSYDLPAGGSWSGYNHDSCPASGCTDIESFSGASPSSGCTLDLTVAPAAFQVGDPIAGTFGCPLLVDAADPTRGVSLVGSFSAVLNLPPE